MLVQAAGIVFLLGACRCTTKRNDMIRRMAVTPTVFTGTAAQGIMTRSRPESVIGLPVSTVRNRSIVCVRHIRRRDNLLATLLTISARDVDIEARVLVVPVDADIDVIPDLNLAHLVLPCGETVDLGILPVLQLVVLLEAGMIRRGAGDHLMDHSHAIFVAVFIVKPLETHSEPRSQVGVRHGHGRGRWLDDDRAGRGGRGRGLIARGGGGS